MTVRRGDWVTTSPGYGVLGIVRRLARDGSWADVEFRDRFSKAWSKRMPTASLHVLTTIPLGDGWTVTDMAREREVEVRP